ncbi:MAG: hypothetical protein ACPG4X_01445, partial [Pikeienuella sp.]
MAERTENGWTKSTTGDLTASEQARKSRETLNETPSSGAGSTTEDKSRVVLHYGEEVAPEGLATDKQSEAAPGAANLDTITFDSDERSAVPEPAKEAASTQSAKSSTENASSEQRAAKAPEEASPSPAQAPAQGEFLALNQAQLPTGPTPPATSAVPQVLPEGQVDTNQINPLKYSLETDIVQENHDGAIIGLLQPLEGTDLSNVVFTLSDDRFVVVDTAEGPALALRPGVALDHEDAATVPLTITATDAGGAARTESFAIEVADLNEAASDITLELAPLAENDAGALIGRLTVFDGDAADQGPGAHSFTLSDDRFVVVDTAEGPA